MDTSNGKASYGKLHDKMAVVIGGGTGIGFAVASRFAKEKAHVLIVGRREKILQQAVEKIGANVSYAVCDVSDDVQTAQLFDSISSIDLLANFAGSAVFGSIDKVSIAEWKDMFESRFWGQLRCVKEAEKKMHKGSSIILCSGLAADVGMDNYLGGAALAGAVDSMAKSLAVELGARGIRVNVLKPGLILNTGLQVNNVNNFSPEHWEKWTYSIIGKIPLSRPGIAEDCAECAMFFALSEYVTGISVAIDGGWSAGCKILPE